MKKKRIRVLPLCAGALLLAAILLGTTLLRGGYGSIREENAGYRGGLER